MIVVKIKGGLGNQMFQYAMARKLQLELGIDQIGLDITSVNVDELRNFELNNFCLYGNAIVLENGSKRIFSKIQQDFARRIVSYCVAGRPEQVAAQREKWLEKLFGLFGIVQKDHCEDNTGTFGLKMHKNIYVNGWFQDAKVAESIRDVLLCDFTETKEVSGHIKKTQQDMEKTESVCVHIRRGDYVGHPRFGVCTDEYYYTAMRKMAEIIEHPIFYIFSDSLDDVKKLKFDYPVIYDDISHDTFESLYLMSKCKHFVISNSTFSWWGQFLARNENKIVIAPNRWCNDFGGTELYMDDWILIEV